MGHSDRIIIADGNFPAESMGKNCKVIRADGHGVPELLDAILTLFPLDTYVEKPVNLMQVMPGDTAKTPIWDKYKAIVAKHDERGNNAIGQIERFERSIITPMSTFPIKRAGVIMATVAFPVIWHCKLK